MGSVSSVSFSPDGRLLVSGSEDRTIRLWNTNTRHLIRTITGHTSPVLSVSFSPNGNTIVSGDGGGTIRLWNTTTGHLIRTITGHTDIVYSVSFSSDGRMIASGSEDKDYPPVGYKHRETYQNNHRDIHGQSIAVSFSPDGRMIASGSEDRTIRLWDTSTAQLIRIMGHTGSVSSVVV